MRFLAIFGLVLIMTAFGKAHADGPSFFFGQLREPINSISIIDRHGVVTKYTIGDNANISLSVNYTAGPRGDSLSFKTPPTNELLCLNGMPLVLGQLSEDIDLHLISGKETADFVYKATSTARPVTVSKSCSYASGKFLLNIVLSANIVNPAQ